MRAINVWVFITSLILAACGGSAADTPGTGTIPTGCVAGARANTSSVALVRAFPNLNFASPIAMIPAPSGNRFYVVERAGVVKAVENSPTSTTTTTFIDITALVSVVGEGGLLGMAFDPQYVNNGFVYLSYTGPARTGAVLVSTIARYTANAARTALDPASAVILLEVDQPYTNHNGGSIAFGNDGYLYFGLGDGGDANDTAQNGQNIAVLLGKILRMDVSNLVLTRNPKYSIPATNPFALNLSRGSPFATSARCVGGCPEIFAWGMRNPWRFSFDRQTGALWAGDVGQYNYEEIDVISVGKNYGWGCYEATRFNTEYLGSCPANLDHVAPVLQYGRAEGSTVTGGYIYHGTAIPALTGQYIFSDFGSGKTWAVSTPYTNPTRRTLIDGVPGVASLAEDAAGELYLINIYNNQIEKLVAANNTPPTPAFPRTLSQTGCANVTDPKLPATGMLAYELNAALWSDGAIKKRWFALPSNSGIQVEANHDWSYPIGSVLRKDFYLGPRIIETRLFARHSDGEWAGYSYEWNVNQTEATLLDSNKQVTINNQVWTYPSPSQCLGCHSMAAGHTLGPETAQLNRDIIDPSNGGTINQLTYLQGKNVFSSTLPDVTTLPRLVDYANPALDVTARARAYLHANCSNCHQPNGPGRGPMDARYSGTFAQMNICNNLPTAGNVLGATHLLTPGAIADSILYQRMHDTGTTRMPPLDTVLEDTVATSLIADWINSINACP
jgi:uncharacterized repeat protein (TIGR03806 family)